MNQNSDDAGVIQVLLDRLNEQRLPRLLDLKARMEAGETLAALDLEFLKEVGEDARHLEPMIDRHPEYQDLAARVLHLYAEIAAQALANEQ